MAIPPFSFENREKLTAVISLWSLGEAFQRRARRCRFPDSRKAEVVRKALLEEVPGSVRPRRLSES
jgi:hypothetical protein